MADPFNRSVVAAAAGSSNGKSAGRTRSARITTMSEPFSDEPAPSAMDFTSPMPADQDPSAREMLLSVAMLLIIAPVTVVILVATGVDLSIIGNFLPG
jgi:hypothetical protein